MMEIWNDVLFVHYHFLQYSNLECSLILERTEYLDFQLLRVLILCSTTAALFTQYPTGIEQLHCPAQWDLINTFSNYPRTFSITNKTNTWEKITSSCFLAEREACWIVLRAWMQCGHVPNAITCTSTRSMCGALFLFFGYDTLFTQTEKALSFPHAQIQMRKNPKFYLDEVHWHDELIAVSPVNPVWGLGRFPHFYFLLRIY